MKDERKIIADLKNEGFSQAETYEEGAGEGERAHAHDFAMKLVVLSGEMQLTYGDSTRTLLRGDEIIVPSNTVHSYQVGSAGCRYIVGERVED